ncbi:hypothetical protein DERF_013554 [Dermatophagoides farinae]|uniref:Uncharacterized protein n=1 Tax=Dermatophagoides farinae TaxID=6954 RepID=A0A922HMJ1_DERFA|nr:hypothetical protein DERF_013554 [Dermatophagoides farinae]
MTINIYFFSRSILINYKLLSIHIHWLLNSITITTGLASITIDGLAIDEYNRREKKLLSLTLNV